MNRMAKYSGDFNPNTFTVHMRMPFDSVKDVELTLDQLIKAHHSLCVGRFGATEAKDMLMHIYMENFFRNYFTFFYVMPYLPIKESMKVFKKSMKYLTREMLKKMEMEMGFNE